MNPAYAGINRRRTILQWHADGADSRGSTQIEHVNVPMFQRANVDPREPAPAQAGGGDNVPTFSVDSNAVRWYDCALAVGAG
jgi:hypothetical protein